MDKREIRHIRKSIDRFSRKIERLQKRAKKYRQDISKGYKAIELFEAEIAHINADIEGYAERRAELIEELQDLTETSHEAE